MMEPRNAELERVIRENPDDANAYAVYGDWLSSQGSPRGELVALQSRGMTAEADALLAAKPELGVGEFREITNVTWHNGFIASARVTNKTHNTAADSVLRALATLLDGPGRFLRELVVGTVISRRFDNDYTPVTTLLAERSPWPTLRSLYFGDFVRRASESNEPTAELNESTIGDLESLYAAVPRLESLTLRSGAMKLGAIDLPELRTLRIISGGVGEASARSIAVANWPKLEKLDVMFGPLADAAPLAPLFEDPRVPALRWLGIKNFTFHRDLVPRLLASKLVAQLRVLDLSMGTLGDDEVLDLARAKSVLGHLDELVVSANYISETGLEILRNLGIPIRSDYIAGAHEIIFGTNDWMQRDDDGEGERYAAVYE